MRYYFCRHSKITTASRSMDTQSNQGYKIQSVMPCGHSVSQWFGITDVSWPFGISEWFGNWNWQTVLLAHHGQKAFLGPLVTFHWKSVSILTFFEREQRKFVTHPVAKNTTCK